MKHCRILILLITIATASNGQKHKAPAFYRDTLSIRLSPLGIADPFDGNFTPGIAYAFNLRWTVSTDVSCIPYSAYMPRNTNAIGYMIKPGIRYYLSDDRKVYVESAFFYKHVSYNINDWLNKNVVNGVPAFQERTTFHYLKDILGLNLQGGLQKGLTRNNRVRLEIYVGLGIRFKWQGIKNDPYASYIPGSIFNTSFYDPYKFNVSIPHGLRIAYIIR